MKSIAYRFWSKSIPLFFVSDLKGSKGDWGYTTDSKKALPLTPAQQKRFAADCKVAGVEAQFVPLQE